MASVIVKSLRLGCSRKLWKKQSQAVSPRLPTSLLSSRFPRGAGERLLVVPHGSSCLARLYRFVDNRTTAYKYDRGSQDNR